jgi:hypothetical protein
LVRGVALAAEEAAFHGRLFVDGLALRCRLFGVA